MWLVFGIAAAAFAFINLAKPDKNCEIFRWASLSLTALALCAFYADGAARVLKEDWGGLMDTMPTLNRALWILTILAIVLNGVGLFKKTTRDN